MKRFLSLLALLLCLACIMGMALACTDVDDPEQTPGEDDPTGEEPVPEIETVDLLGSGASTIRVVRGDQYTVENTSTKAAMQLREGLMSTTGAEVGIVTDYETDTDDILEFVVGKTNRTIGTQLDLAD